MKDPFAKPDELRLEPIDVAGWPAPIALRDGRLTLGRDPENDVVLPGATFPSVSGHHARVERRDARLWVVDLGSRNGTLVNGERARERRLRVGDVLQLGALGPRFTVTGPRALDETMFVDPKAAGLGAELSEQHVETLVRRGTRANLRRMIALLSLAALGVVAFFVVRTRSEERERREERRAIEQGIAEAGEALEARLAAAWARVTELEARERSTAERDAAQEARLVKWEADVRRSEQELAERLAANESVERGLLERIKQLEEGEAEGGDDATAALVEHVRRDLEATRGALELTRTELAEARRRVDLLDPVNLAQARLSGVAAVSSAIVLIENRLVLRNKGNGKLMHLEGAGFAARPNFEDKGTLWTLDSTGSGFCVSPEGWIVTNRHVVAMPEDNEILLATRDLPIEPVQELRAVFSGDTLRRTLKVVRRAPGDVDLALAKIEPFAGMPHLQRFDLETPPPPPGSDIYLFGFPLGHFALQEGERVIASTFRGILSRNVGGQMQVDAGVHPGNSGGPITDAEGHVVGVVFSVQALPDQTAVYTIGYGIPLADLRSIWPPPAAGEDADGDEGGG